MNKVLELKSFFFDPYVSNRKFVGYTFVNRYSQSVQSGIQALHSRDLLAKKYIIPLLDKNDNDDEVFSAEQKNYFEFLKDDSIAALISSSGHEEISHINELVKIVNNHQHSSFKYPFFAFNEEYSALNESFTAITIVAPIFVKESRFIAELFKLHNAKKEKPQEMVVLEVGGGNFYSAIVHMDYSVDIKASFVGKEEVTWKLSYPEFMLISIIQNARLA